MSVYEKFIEGVRKLLPGMEHTDLRAELYKLGEELRIESYREGSEMAQSVWREKPKPVAKPTDTN